MSNTPEKHYVAQIKVERVIKRTGISSESKRDITEALNITIKSATLDGLKTKVSGHLALIDEEDV